jgi:methylenetetrahydrofolate dehydrogenase (NADP+) / methenyltetrahydrofolate cyclohydrolase
MTRMLDGRVLAGLIQAEVTVAADELAAAGTPPVLAVVLATEDESAAWYVRSIGRTGKRCGVRVRVVDLGAAAAAAQVRSALAELAGDVTVHGIILQTPLPKGVNGTDLAGQIPAGKDVDGANPLSAGRLATAAPAFAPATAAAVLELLRHDGTRLEGVQAVVVGRSTVVGKPVVQLLLAENATVTVCHSRTRDLPEVCRRADVLVAAIGRPRMIGREYVRDGATVIDVGTTPDADGNLVGDVDAADMHGVAGALTPVPGGVGPVTTAILFRHVIAAATGWPGATDH